MFIRRIIAMAFDQLKIRSRSKLLLVASFTLLLINVRNFITLSRGLTLIAGPISYVLFFTVIWNLYRIYDETSTVSVDTISDSWKTAALAISGTTLLLVSRFAHLKPSLHGLSDIAGWLLVLASWLLPRSRWQAVAVAGFYLIVLNDIRWKEFAAFRGVPIYIPIALAALWLTVSALTYLFLSRRKPDPSPSGLN
jgi:hypothetical protein